MDMRSVLEQTMPGPGFLLDRELKFKGSNSEALLFCTRLCAVFVVDVKSEYLRSNPFGNPADRVLSGLVPLSSASSLL